MFLIRSYYPTDLPFLYDICLKTADSGKSAEGLLSNRALPAQVFLAPYLFFEPDLTFILAKNEIPVGYITGASDSKAFQNYMNNEWQERLKKVYSPAGEQDSKLETIIKNKLYQGYDFKKEFQEYSAHLHINILPEGQGRGNGRMLIDVFIQALKVKNVNGLHLEVGKRNERAIRFYEKNGFEKKADFPFSIGYIRKF